ncbi:MAG: SOS response-associated peptidase family protein [Gemmatimonadota bacterium]|nr:SOS response-associated peptidase family protein [Gemmatimonadota bacterium]
MTQQLSPDQICDLYRVRGTPPPPDRPPRYNGAPGQDVTACRVEEHGARATGRLRWGLVPSWARAAAASMSSSCTGSLNSAAWTARQMASAHRSGTERPRSRSTGGRSSRRRWRTWSRIRSRRPTHDWPARVASIWTAPRRRRKATLMCQRRPAGPLRSWQVISMV